MSFTPTAAVRLLALVAVLTVISIAPASAVSTSTYEKQVVQATNSYRAAQGKVAVKLQKCVDRWANGQATWMAKHKSLAHRNGRLLKIMKDCHLTGASENIAWNYSTGRKAVAAWAASPGHATNMRASSMRYIGVGVARASNGEVYVAQVFGTRK